MLIFSRTGRPPSEEAQGVPAVGRPNQHLRSEHEERRVRRQSHRWDRSIRQEQYLIHQELSQFCKYSNFLWIAYYFFEKTGVE